MFNASQNGFDPKEATLEAKLHSALTETQENIMKPSFLIFAECKTRSADESLEWFGGRTERLIKR